MGELCRTHGVAALYVTHDLAVIANIADRVAVMYAGQIAELGARETIFAAPDAPLHAGAARLDPAPEPGPRAQRHPRPHAGARRAPARLPVPRPVRVRGRRLQAGRARAPRRSRPGHQVRCIRAERDRRRGTSPAARCPTPTPTSRATSSSASRTSASSTAASRSSSTSPSTSARPRWWRWSASPAPARPRSRAASAACTRTGPARSTFEGTQLGHGSRSRSAADRKRIQYIFQNPYLSLNPRLTIEQIVKRPMELFGIAERQGRHRAAWSSCSTRWRSARPC